MEALTRSARHVRARRRRRGDVLGSSGVGTCGAVDASSSISIFMSTGSWRTSLSSWSLYWTSILTAGVGLSLTGVAGESMAGESAMSLWSPLREWVLRSFVPLMCMPLAGGASSMVEGGVQTRDSHGE